MASTSTSGRPAGTAGVSSWKVAVGELLPDQPLPLPKKRLDISREQALKLWSEKAKEGWRTTAPQWQPPPIPNAERRSTLG